MPLDDIEILISEKGCHDERLLEQALSIRNTAFDSVYTSNYPASKNNFMNTDMVYALSNGTLIGYLTYKSARNLGLGDDSVWVRQLLNLRAEHYLQSDRLPFPELRTHPFVVPLECVEFYEGEFNFAPRRDTYIDEIAVLPKYQEQGVGSEMFGTLANQVFANSNIYLSARSEGPSPSRPVFERWGFNPVVMISDYLPDGTKLTLMQYSV